MRNAEDTPLWQGLDLRWVYSDLLLSISRRTQCVHRAYDILHDALVRYVLAGRHRSISQPHAYLRTVVGSVLADHWQDSTRYLLLHDRLEEMDSASPALPDALAPSAERLVDIQQRLHAVHRILDCLPPRCREVFWLYRIEGLTQPEIAGQLGISVNMVERHVMRALVDLRSARDLLVL